MRSEAMGKKWIVLGPLALRGILRVMAMGGEIVRQLWNGLLPPLFGWRTLTFWQAVGMLVLCRMLFGGFGLHGCSRSRSRGRMAALWDQMTPEERERFLLALRGRGE